MLGLEIQERQAHDHLWKRRGVLITRVQNVLREIDMGVAAVIEADTEPVASFTNGGDRAEARAALSARARAGQVAS